MAEPLRALKFDQLERAEGRIKLWLREYSVATNAAAEPCGVRFLIGERACSHRAEFRREKFGIMATAAEHDERASFSNHRRSHRTGELIGVLVRKHAVCCELSSLRK